MKAKIKKTFYLYFSRYELVDENDLDFDPADVSEFYEGLEVEVLKVIKDESYAGGNAYVLINPVNNEVAVVDIMFLEIN